MERQSDDESSKSESLCKDIEGAAGNTAIEDIGLHVDLTIDVIEEIIHESIDEATSADEEMLRKDPDGTSSINKDVPNEIISENQEIIQQDPSQTTSANGGMISEDNVEVKSEDSSEMKSEDSSEIASDDSVGITSEDSVEITREDEPQVIESFKDWPIEDQRCFVRKLIESVQIIRNAFNGKRYNSRFPKKGEGQNIISVPKEWKRTMRRYIRSQRRNFKSLIKRSAKESSIPDIFEICKNAFIDMYKPEKYSEMGTVSFSTAIAYLGIHLYDKGLDIDAPDKAQDFILLLLRQSSEQETLSESSE